MWKKVATRSHRPEKIFAFGAASDQVMIYGTVDFVLTDGRGTSVPWAARARFAEQKGDEELKMRYYQVYMVRHCSLFESNPSIVG